MSFQTALDICNRAVQHCGVRRMTSLTENSVQAGECNFVYDKLRRAELRRNVWQFSIRKAALRAIDVDTMMISPVLWASTTTYAYGAIVVDSSGTIWQSQVQDNLNNQPGSSTSWEVYFGPVSVTPFDRTGTTGYYSGELVYEAPGDGTYSVYMSLQSNNTQDPRAQTLWNTTTQYQKDMVVRYDAPWSSATTYAQGDVRRYSGVNYVSLAGSNTNHQPDTSPTWWLALSSSLAPQFYDSQTTYNLNDLASYRGQVYLSIAASNLNNQPDISASSWKAIGNGTVYVSLIDVNLDNDPSLAPAIWAVGTTYAAGNKVGASNGYIYTSVGSGNLGNDPSLDTLGTYWTNTGVLNPWSTVNNFGTAADQWLQLSISLKDLDLIYPIGTGPVIQASSKNVYRLPANFLRRAPQEPKAGSVSFLGAPTGLMYDDWQLEGNYLVSRDAHPILLRFCADVQNVARMDDMFCEGLAARIGMEIVERVTQSTAKLGAIAGLYKQFMTEARTVNGIETGAQEPPEDDYITCRI